MWRPTSDSRAPTGAAPQILVWLAVALLPAFAVTTLVTQAYRAEQLRLAAEWFDRGSAALDHGRPNDAIAAFQNALTFSREDRLFRLRLAQALAAAGRTPEARAHLRTLRDAQPGNGPVNLELARLSARDHDVAGAHRYYHDAIEGAWSDTAEIQRRMVRLELAEFLVEKGATPQAQAELISLEGDLPADRAVQKRIGALMLAAGLARRARSVYESISGADPRDAEALAGAGRAAFDEGSYPAAVSFLSKAAAAGSSDPAVEGTLATARLVVRMDPYQRRLTIAARATRARRALDAARARLQTCAGAAGRADLQPLVAELRDFEARIRGRVRADPDAVDETMELVFRIEQTTTQACGEPPGGPDLALWLLARQRSGGMP